MALTAADKTWLRKMFREEVHALLDDMVAGLQQAGGYDGATQVVDDDWADEGRKRRRIGFATTLTGGIKKMLK